MYAIAGHAATGSVRRLPYAQPSLGDRLQPGGERRFFGKDEYAKGAESYLAEGIDCNEDGEYAERSAAIYNCVNNNAMIDLEPAPGRKNILTMRCGTCA